MNPSVSQYVLYLGDAYFNTKQDALAKASYDRALTLAPRDANVIFALGVYWVRMKNAALAREQKIKLDVLETKLAADLQTRMNNAGLRPAMPTMGAIKPNGAVAASNNTTPNAPNAAGNQVRLAAVGR